MSTVTVCSACLRACCWLGRFMCDQGKTAGTIEKTVDELRVLNREHPSYWRTKKGDDLDMPRSIDDIRELAEFQRGKSNHPDDAQIFASYLVGELGFDPYFVKETLRDVWPEASEATWTPDAPDGGV